MLALGNFGCLGLRRGAYWVEQSKASDPPPEGPQEVARGDGGDGAAGGGVGQMVPKLMCTPCGTRAHNLRIRGPTPCPSGQGGLEGAIPSDITAQYGGGAGAGRAHLSEDSQEVARSDGGGGGCRAVGVQTDAHPCGTRAHNLRISIPTPCPSGQGGIKRDQASQSTKCNFGCLGLRRGAYWVEQSLGPCSLRPPPPPAPPRPASPRYSHRDKQ